MEGGKLAIILIFTCIVTVLGENYAKPQWSETYTVEGILHIPYAEIEEPFSAWFDGPSKQSRIDYYGGTANTYQLGNKKAGYGLGVKIVPVTTEEKENVKTCFLLEGNAKNKIVPQTVLPSLADFKYADRAKINGISTERWILTLVVEEKVNTYEMWVAFEADPNNATQKMAVPVKYEMHGYNPLFHSHYDHYYFVYNSYHVNNIPQSIFQVDLNIKCKGLFLTEENHIYTFNPMAEFIRPEKSAHLDYSFEKFKNKHGIIYQNGREHMLRKEIFRQNIRFIHSVNRRNLGYSLAVNHLADKNEAELKALRGRRYSGEYNGGKPFPYQNFNKNDTPEHYDWRFFGAVTPVKDQSVCGSCWSFSATGAIEGAYFLHNGGRLVRLSQQALVDCSWGYYNYGCDGGLDFKAYRWILKHGGVPTDDEYGPYLGQDGYCRAENVPKVAKITGWVNVTARNEDALRLAIFKHGPVSIGIYASVRSFIFYSNGIFYDHLCKSQPFELNHAVLAVGYGTFRGSNYLIVKNSWSTYWGNDGYILMSMKDNNCGVMTEPTYVTM